MFTSSTFRFVTLGKIVSISVVFACVTYAFYASALSRNVAIKSRETDRPQLVVPETDLNLGGLWAESIVVKHFHVRNTGKHKVRVLSFRGGCSCIGFEPRQALLEPGQLAKVKLTVDLAKSRPATYDIAVPLELHIIPEIEEVAHAGWKFKGHVRNAPVDFSEELNFGYQNVEGEDLTSRTFTATLYEEGLDLDATCSDGRFMVTQRQSDVPKEALFEVTPSKSLDDFAGTFSALLKVSFVSKGRGETLRLPIKWGVVQRFRAIPDQCYLGQVPVGTHVVGDVVVESRLSQEFDVVGVKSDANDVLIRPIKESSRPNQTRKELRLNFGVSRLGNHVFPIAIIITSKDRQELLPVRFSYSGKADAG